MIDIALGAIGGYIPSAQTPGGPVAISFVLIDGKKEFRLIRTDLIVASGAAKRQ
jgi:hypothetical protein